MPEEPFGDQTSIAFLTRRRAVLPEIDVPTIESDDGLAGGFVTAI
jgi:hypothetical protein